MSDHDITSVLSFGSIDQMSNKNKGSLGEALAGIWLKDQIKQDPSIITDKEFSEPDPKLWFSHIGRNRCRYGKVDDDGLEKISWEPDYSFHVTLPDYDVRKEVLVEAKTGDSGLERDQLDVMRLVAQEERTTVFLCEITFHSEQAILSYEEIISSDFKEEIKDSESYECYDCGSEVDPDTARLAQRDGSPVYLCPEQECR